MVTEIAELQNGEATIYPGNYTDYEEGRGERVEQIAREQEKIDVERKHLEKFVERFRYKASKATQAQSRLKRLEKLEDVRRVLEHKENSFSFPGRRAVGEMGAGTKKCQQALWGFASLQSRRYVGATRRANCTGGGEWRREINFVQVD